MEGDSDLTASRKVHITCNGCRPRRLDAARFRHYFRSNGWVTTTRSDEAEVTVFLTCGFNKLAEDDSVAVIERLDQFKGRIIIGGCLPEISPQRVGKTRLELLSGRDLQQIDELFPEFRVKFESIPEAHECDESLEPDPMDRGPDPFVDPDQRVEVDEGTLPQPSGVPPSLIAEVKSREAALKPPTNNPEALLNFAERELKKRKVAEKAKQSAYLRVARGCLGRCTFCAIRTAIGELTSKSIDECVSEYQQLIRSGFHRFMIISDDTGAYGLDIDTSLPELLDRLAEEDGAEIAEWALFGLDPKWVVHYQSDLMRHVESGRIYHLELGVQSGSRRILQLMNRDPRTCEIAGVIEEFRASTPLLFVDAHAIVGFPTESHADFLRTIDLLSNLKCDEARLLSYWDRPGTPTSRMSGAVPLETIQQRLDLGRGLLSKEGIHAYCD